MIVAGALSTLSDPLEWSLEGSQARDPHYWKEARNVRVLSLEELGATLASVQENCLIPKRM